MNAKQCLKWYMILHILILHPEQNNQINLKVLFPHTMTTQDIEAHTHIASETFFLKDSTLVDQMQSNAHVDKKEYQDWFKKLYKSFSHSKNTEFIITAYEDNELVGSLYCQEHTPFDTYTCATVSDHYYYVYLLFVSQSHQRKGIAIKLLTHLDMINKKNTSLLPIFLYTHAANTKARALYENTGFVLVKDQDHEDGIHSKVAQFLGKEDELNLPLVAYRKN